MRTTTPRMARRGFAMKILFLIMFLAGNMSIVYARQVAGDQPASERSAPKMAVALQAPTCYTLSLSFTGSGSMPTASPLNSTDCAAGQYIAGESITLTASPAAGYTVTGWTGTDNNSSTSTTNTVIMPAADHAAAVNYAACYTLALSHTGTGSDPTAIPTISPGCTGGGYIAGESITLTASAGAGFTVGGWTGTDDDLSTSMNNTLLMPAADHAVAVNYVACYTLTVSHTGLGSDPSTSPTNSPGCAAGLYTAGESITLTASPGAGYVVGSWTGTDDDLSTSTNNTLIMPAADHAAAVNYVGLPPGDFGKTSPANGATGQATSVTLQWGTSSNVTNYQYCYATSTAACTNWTNTGTTTSASISGLSQSTIYYWHVRAVNATSTTYSDTASTAFWSFTTSGPPGAFGKTSPANGAINQLPSLTLSWGTSINAVSYAYCYDTTPNNNCNPWINVGAATSANISGLKAGTTHYWHVRANNAQGTTYSNGVDTAFWSFTTGPAPVAFSRISPTNGAINQALNLNLSWGASSNADSYEYCWAVGVTCSNWTSAGTNTSISIGPLTPVTSYAWHVRAINVYGVTYAGGDPAIFWTFTTGGAPGAFGKTTPTDAAINQPLNLNLSWGASTNAVSYEYCLAAGATCSNWADVGNVTTIPVGSLTPSTTYAWHVRAVNPIDTTYSNGAPTSFWSFTTGPVPGPFGKTSPADNSSDQSLSLSLSWGTSSNAASYEYCLAAGATCSNWTNVGNVTSFAVGPLNPSTTYAWHVRAVTVSGTTFSNGSATAFWSFTTGPAPGAFNKTSPANLASGLPLSLSLTWGASTNVTSYQYCIDTTNDNGCTSPATWNNVGNVTSVNLSNLAENTPYYWHVRANNAFGTTYSNGNLATAFWSFTTGGVPGDFFKTSPLNAATGQPLSLSLIWETSTAVDYYEYCYATTTTACNTNWINAGTATSATISGLTEYTMYYWHVRAQNSFGITYSGGASNAYRTFTTGGVPGAFNKTGPTNGATNRPISLNLSWQASSTATSYEYCYDTTNDGLCAPWVDAGNATTVTISGLTHSTTYYWHVLARNSFGQTYSNGNLSTAFWSFTTGPAPAAFSKALPLDAAGNQPLSLSLDWNAATGATSYEYCYDSSNDGACSNWTSVGTATIVSIGGLAHSTTYYWQVRANNNYGTTYANGSETAYWSFTTGPAPGAFNKTSPANTATGQLLSLTLGWEASLNAVSYEYCYATSTATCTNWTGTGGTSATISGLTASTTYYWHVRAVNIYGTTFSNGDYWSFTTGSKPGIFNKTSPDNGATNQLLSLTLQWGASSGVTYYEYCIDPPDNNNSACGTGWQNVGTDTSVAINGLTQNTTYYWHVRAVNSYGISHANGSITAYWSFTTGPAPGAFTKSSPANGATDRPLTLTLQWAPSANAAGYEYCYDTSNNNSCNSWTDAGNVTSVIITDLIEYTTYYWHVLAYNDFGQAYSDGTSNAFRSFKTGGIPGNFNKTGPANAGSVFNAQPLSPTLAWNPSSGTPGIYEYCYDTSDDGACAPWIDAGTATSAALSGLQPSTRYYWHVRAVNDFGTTPSNGSDTAYWSFVTRSVCPPITAWKGEYWANNALSGPAVLCRNDADINFEWGYDPPTPPLSYDNFSIRWSRSVRFAIPGIYRFYLLHDDGARLYVDGVKKKDSWGTCCTTETVDVRLSAGYHTIRLDMHEDSGNANAHLWWEQISQELTSAGALDGWILESAETSSKGGSMSAAGGVFFLGDNALNRQYRTILSFNTASLPNDAIITSVTLKIKQAGLVGTNPFTTHGNILVDLRTSGFNSNTALELVDFQAPANKDAAMTFTNNPVSGWYTKNLGPANFGYINKSGITQFRLRFTLDDNNDLGADYLRFYSGNYATAAYRPQLIIRYTLP